MCSAPLVSSYFVNSTWCPNHRCQAGQEELKVLGSFLPVERREDTTVLTVLIKCSIRVTFELNHMRYLQFTKPHNLHLFFRDVQVFLGLGRSYWRRWKMRSMQRICRKSRPWRMHKTWQRCRNLDVTMLEFWRFCRNVSWTMCCSKVWKLNQDRNSSRSLGRPWVHCSADPQHSVAYGIILVCGKRIQETFFLDVFLKVFSSMSMTLWVYEVLCAQWKRDSWAPAGIWCLFAASAREAWQLRVTLAALRNGWCRDGRVASGPNWWRWRAPSLTVLTWEVEASVESEFCRDGKAFAPCDGCVCWKLAFWRSSGGQIS